MIQLSLKNIFRKKSRALLIFLLSIIASFNIFTQIAQKNSVQSNLKKLIGEAISGQYIFYDSAEKLNVLESQFSDLQLFDWNAEKTAQLKNRVDNIKYVSPRLRFGGMLSYGEESVGINLQAITSEHIQRVSSILEFEAGKMPQKESEIMISQSFADLLETKVGDTLVILANNKDGYLSDNLLKVSGIFKTNGLAQFLIPIGYIFYEKGKEITGLEENETMELLVNFDQLEDSDENEIMLTEAITSINSDLRHATWAQSSPMMNSIVSLWVNLGHAIKIVFLSFSFLILLNIIVMMTNNRKREIGTLLAFGFRPFRIINAISLEYVLLVVTGVVLIGTSLKWTFELFFKDGIAIPWEGLQTAYLSAYIVPEIHWKDIILVCLFFCIACYLAVFISLRKLPKSEITTLLRTKT